MKHLVLVAYPVINNFTMVLTSAYAEQLILLGHDQRTVDLYRMGFNSIINGDGGMSPRESHEQNSLQQTDVITLLYPLWWLSMPAIMKGYIDRVFARGSGADANHGDGLLFGKKAVLITFSGAPLSTLIESGKWSALQTEQNKLVLDAAGFELIDHLHFSEVTPKLPPKLEEQYTNRVRDFACQQFPSY